MSFCGFEAMGQENEGGLVTRLCSLHGDHLALVENGSLVAYTYMCRSMVARGPPEASNHTNICPYRGERNSEEQCSSRLEGARMQPGRTDLHLDRRSMPGGAYAMSLGPGPQLHRCLV
jgi:hypothetical protein